MIDSRDIRIGVEKLPVYFLLGKSSFGDDIKITAEIVDGKLRLTGTDILVIYPKVSNQFDVRVCV